MIICFLCPSQVKVLYGGTELFDDEVRHIFHNDMMLAIISGGCITVLVYVLTSFSGTVWPASYTTVFISSVFELHSGFDHLVVFLLLYSISDILRTGQHWTELLDGSLLIPRRLWCEISGHSQWSGSFCYNWNW